MEFRTTFRIRNPPLFFILLIATTISILQFEAYYFTSILVLTWIFMEYFYRLPIAPSIYSEKEKRKLDKKLGLVPDFSIEDLTVYAPNYGTIKKIERTPEYTRIISVLDLMDIHYQFSPIHGSLTRTEYKPGEFYIAGLLDKSKYNERNHCIFKSYDGITVEVIQIAGVLAKRIEILDKKKKNYHVGEPYGIIHFGSRVDTIVPNSVGNRSFKLLVKEGEKLRGFNTKLGLY